MNHFLLKCKNDKRKFRTISIQKQVEKDIKQVERISKKHNLRVERLMSINLKEIKNNSSLSFSYKTQNQSLSYRKEDSNFKVSTLDDYNTLPLISPMNCQHYWARLAYRQSHLDSDRQYKNL